jgi:hypothetical protein
MRKNAGFMIMTLLLLIVPALANAWTLTVKVVGGSATNNVQVAYGTTLKTLTSGTYLLYPTKQVTFYTNGSGQTLTLNNAPTTVAALNALVAGPQTVGVTYAATATNAGVAITQADGGVIYAENKNNTWTNDKVIGLVAGSTVPVSIAADSNHKITKYTVNGVDVTTGFLGTAGEVLPITVAATAPNATVTATFGVFGKVSAALFAPTDNIAGTAVNATITATSNDTIAQYFLSTTGVAGLAAAIGQASPTFALPTLAGTYSLVAKVTTTNGGSFTTSPASYVVAPAASVNNGCTSCHATSTPLVVSSFATQPYVLPGGSAVTTCVDCHSATAPHAQDCTKCHSDLNAAGVPTHAFAAGGPALIPTDDCVACHAVAIDHSLLPGVVNDNNGVRVITGANGEFGENPVKKSHHVVNADGSDPTSAQCIVCHAEGMVVGGAVKINPANHMADAKIHLRNGGGVASFDGIVKASLQGGVSQFSWDPITPDHVLMDQFCFSCHNAAGAPAAVTAVGAALIPGQTARNPFGDTISNGYDQMSRGNVVNVFDAFAPGNVSHHAVRAAKYTVRTSPTSPAARTAVWSKYSSATNPGARKTLFEAGAFVTAYTPLGAAASVADDSMLHCGDCHSVGQWKPASTTNALGTPTTVAIGAHGSVNEYMLRNAFGTDALHHQGGYNGSVAGVVSADGGNYVCYLCHNISKYNGADGTHNGIDEGPRCNGQETVGLSGVQTVVGVATGQGKNQTANIYRVSGIAASGAQGNVFGYSCAYCHNAGNQGFGGIHGSNTSFKAYSGAGATNTQQLIDRKPYRFMGGLSLKYNGGNNAGVNPGTWERKALSSTSREGCYNLTTTADRGTFIYNWGTNATVNGTLTSLVQDDGTINGSWGACGHHTGASTVAAGTMPNRKIQRPLSY